MLTYVINTSENRSLESDRLFDLTGYNKIRWLNCPLNEIGQCAKHIFEKQNLLGADDFRIAVIVDFYGFDRIRIPYRRHGYKPESNVDISLYLPYIEAYLFDNLIEFLENRELVASDFEIYYVHNTKFERYEFIDNAKEQLKQILSGGMLCEDVTPPVTKESDSVPMPEDYGDFSENDNSAEVQNKEENSLEDNKYYSTFDLYCTLNTTLTFLLSSYPYGREYMTFSQFIKAFHSRNSVKTNLRRHYYISNYGGGQARAAFDTLTLSLHLIRMYEREESFEDDDSEIEIAKIDAEMLKDVLVNAWNKVCIARELSKSSNTAYYALKENINIDIESLKPKDKAGLEVLVALRKEDLDNMSVNDIYKKISYYYERTPEQLAADNRLEFDRLMNEYLRRRDETTELNVETELSEKISNDALVTTAQFPSREDYMFLVSQKQKEISACFDRALSASYREMDYTEEKKAADIAYEDYNKFKACLHRNIIGDIVFLFITLLVSVGPYILLQVSGFELPFISSFILSMETTALFAVLFIVSVALQFTILTAKMLHAKSVLKQVYRDCYQKECDSLIQLRTRYEEDLLFIERSRYEIRQLKYLYEANLAKDNNVKKHRNLLKELQDHLSGMLNHLEVEPVYNSSESLDGEFDVTKPIRSHENKVYRIFSLETIEKLFSKKGRKKP